MPHDIFISYAREDETHAREIARALAKGGVACWLDREGIRFGESYSKVIDKAIRDTRVVLWLGSRHSIASQFVHHEISSAQAYRKPVGLVMLEPLDFAHLPPPFNITIADKQGVAFFEGSFEENCARLMKDVKRLVGQCRRRALRRKALVAMAVLLCIGAAVWAGSALHETTPEPHQVPDRVAALPAGDILKIAYEQAPPAPPAQYVHPGLQLEILVKHAGQAAFSKVSDGDSITSEKDDYLIVARPLTGGYLYIFQVDSEGKTDWLFPKNPGSPFSGGANPVEEAKIIQIPAEQSNQVLYLDTTTGVEHIYAVFSATRWTALEESLQKMQSSTATPAPTAAAQEIAMRVEQANGLQMRGVGGARVQTGTVDSEQTLVAARVYQDHTFALPISTQPYQASSSFLVVERWFHHVKGD